MMENYLEFAKKLARDAGEIMQKYFNQAVATHYKGDKTIVTAADEEINQMVIDRVQEKYPEHGVFGEEQSFGQDKITLWVCDPVDGTAMFARGIPTAVFSIALVEDGVPKIGVVYDPFMDKMWYASVGGGAFCDDKPVYVNETLLADNSATVNFDTSARYMPKGDASHVAQKIVQYADERVYLVSIGSIIHAGCLVAEGKFVAEITGVTKGKNMDVAALKVIVEEAGGRVTDIFGNEQRYDRDINGAIISNAVVFDELMRVGKGEK
ncbi:MAG: inositol monophosphatase [Candidatus Nomurabacteria bacterium]|jgi:fructose-1,6-bisphosphatase/inositol monophosphatase family enzyme|nr:inositol monophosphatase [Candidatus Nomurabacteria bacterium]